MATSYQIEDSSILYHGRLFPLQIREGTPSMYREEERTPYAQYDLTDILTDIVYVAADRLQVDVAKHIGERISLYQSGAVKVATSLPD